MNSQNVELNREISQFSVASFICASTVPMRGSHWTSRTNSEIPMKRALCVSAILAAAMVAPVSFADDHEIPLSAVIQRAPGVGYGAINAALNSYCSDIHYAGTAFGDNIRLMRYELRGNHTQQQVHDAIQGLVTQGMLVFGEADFTAHKVDGQTGSAWVTDLGATTFTYHNQYAFGTHGFDAAHDRSRGAGVVVAVIDSGVDSTHEAVHGPVTAWQWDFVNDNAYPIDGGDGIDNDSDGVIDDGVGHGTYVTSLIRLAAPEARLMHLRVLDDEGSCDSFRLSAAIHSAIDHGADVINVSVSTEFNSSMLADAIVRARAAGIIVVAAMGNDGLPIPSVLEYPAVLPQTIAVCAIDHLGLKGSFSNFGSCTDFSAAGVSFVSPTGQFDLTTSVLGAVPGEGYAHWSGTSLAAAFVSSAAALVRAQYPQWPDASVPASEIPNTVMALLGQTATSIDSANPGFAGLLGTGRINADGAVLLGPPVARLADLDRDGRIDGGDLAMVLSSWGVCGASVDCEADFDGNGYVDGADLAVIMANWG